jgi:hypothetical protein
MAGIDDVDVAFLEGLVDDGGELDGVAVEGAAAEAVELGGGTLL